MNLWNHRFSQNTNKRLSRLLPSLHRAEPWQFFVSCFGRNDDWNSEIVWPLVLTVEPFPSWIRIIIFINWQFNKSFSTYWTKQFGRKIFHAREFVITENYQKMLWLPKLSNQNTVLSIWKKKCNRTTLTMFLEVPTPHHWHSIQTMTKNGYFWTNYPPFLLNVISECSLIWAIEFKISNKSWFIFPVFW